MEPETETKPVTSEAVALTEKKIGMALDDIVKLSKNSKANEGRVSNKSQKYFNNRGFQKNPLKVRQYMDSRYSFRQGVLAKRRSNFNGNQFPVKIWVPKKAAAAPIRNRVYNGNRMVNKNSIRVRAPLMKKKVTGGDFAGKQWQQKTVPMQRPLTLDARFANLKQQRMRALSRRNDAKR